MTEPATVFRPRLSASADTDPQDLHTMGNRTVSQLSDKPIHFSTRRNRNQPAALQATAAATQKVAYHIFTASDGKRYIAHYRSFAGLGNDRKTLVHETSTENWTIIANAIRERVAEVFQSNPQAKSAVFTPVHDEDMVTSLQIENERIDLSNDGRVALSHLSNTISTQSPPAPAAPQPISNSLPANSKPMLVDPEEDVPLKKTTTSPDIGLGNTPNSPRSTQKSPTDDNAGYDSSLIDETVDSRDVPKVKLTDATLEKLVSKVERGDQIEETEMLRLLEMLNFDKQYQLITNMSNGERRPYRLNSLQQLQLQGTVRQPIFIPLIQKAPDNQINNSALLIHPTTTPAPRTGWRSLFAGNSNQSTTRVTYFSQDGVSSTSHFLTDGVGDSGKTIKARVEDLATDNPGLGEIVVTNSPASFTADNGQLNPLNVVAYFYNIINDRESEQIDINALQTNIRNLASRFAESQEEIEEPTQLPRHPLSLEPPASPLPIAANENDNSSQQLERPNPPFSSAAPIPNQNRSRKATTTKTFPNSTDQRHIHTRTSRTAANHNSKQSATLSFTSDLFSSADSDGDTAAPSSTSNPNYNSDIDNSDTDNSDTDNSDTDSLP